MNSILHEANRRGHQKALEDGLTSAEMEAVKCCVKNLLDDR